MDAQSSQVHPLFPKPLSIAKVIAPLKYKREIVRALEDLGQVEPIKVDPRTGSDEIEVEKRRNQLEMYQSKLVSYFSAIDTDKIATGDPVKIGSSEEDVLNFISEVVEDKGSRIDEIIIRKEDIENRLSELDNILELLTKFNSLDIKDTALLKDTRHVKTFIGTIFPAQLQRLYWEIDEVTESRYLMIEHNIDKENTLLALSVLQKDADVVSSKLKTFSFSDVIIPNDVDLDGLTEADCYDEIAQLEKEESQIDDELDQLTIELGNQLVAAREAVEIELNRISVEKKMRRTKTTCVLWAWVPEELQDEFKTKLHSATEGSATFDFRKGNFDPEYTPTRVENSEFMEPMRGLVSSFGTPGLNEVDPYKFVVVLFPVLFAIMFADVGHGLLLFLFGLWARNKRKHMKEEPTGLSAYIYNGANLMIIMGITSFFMGFALNSIFGDETLLWQVPFLSDYILKPLFQHTTWEWLFHVEELHGHMAIERDYLGFLIFSFVIGAIVIIMGLLLNLYQLYHNVYTQKDHMADWWAGITLFATYFFIIVTALVVVLFSDIPILLYIGIGLIILSIIATLVIEGKAHGVDGLMLGFDHILALVSNTLSFGRLLAMNTIHFVLAFLPYLFILGGANAENLNHYVDTWYAPDQYWIWALCAFIGSLIVVPVETTFSTLQSLRLNWVEFFGKFYDGTGVEFKPIKVGRVYTTEN